MALGGAQRSRLARVKLRALVRDRFGERQWVDEDVGGLAAVHDGHDGFVLVEDGTTGLGHALVWADKVGLDGDLHLVADRDAGVAARRATFVSRPVHVWRVEGTSLVAAEPEAQLPLVPPAEAAMAAAEPLRAQGATVVAEHGVVMAEVLGLEIGRVVPDSTAQGGWVLEVGVGKNDRAASVLMEAVRPKEAALLDVVELVHTHRRPDASPHLLNRLARPRWLRDTLLADPGAVGATSLVAVEAARPRLNLVDAAPALALGVRPDGTAVVVACSVGVDLEALPSAADARDRLAPDAELVLVTPARDQYPTLRRLAELLLPPARLVAHEGDWPK